MKPYAISTCDGHNEEWEYIMNESEAMKRFEALKYNETDIHLYEYNPEQQNYDVIDSFWIGDYQCPNCGADEIYYVDEDKMMCGDCHNKGTTDEFGRY